jgi:hypothetical protein
MYSVHVIEHISTNQVGNWVLFYFGVGCNSVRPHPFRQLANVYVQMFNDDYSDFFLLKYCLNSEGLLALYDLGWLREVAI